MPVTTRRMAATPKTEMTKIAQASNRRKTATVSINNIKVGSDHPVVVQSMTNTDTADAKSTAKQVAELARAGSELVRITVNTLEAAAAVPEIQRRLDMMSCDVPLIGDFHYNGHELLQQVPECASILAKYRINPGNVGFGRKRENQFATIIEQAIEARQTGPDWRELGQPGRTPAGPADGRKRGPEQTPRRLGGDARSPDPFSA